MQDIINLPLEEQQQLFIETAKQGGFISPIFIERDFWACWILQQIFSEAVTAKSPTLFLKGSFPSVKAYHAIERIYADLDLMINRDDLGFDEDIFELVKEDSETISHYKKKIFSAKADYIHHILYPFLLERCAEKIPGAWCIKINRPFDPYLSFDPPRSLPGLLYSTDKIQPWVKIDFDISASHYETKNIESRDIKPYVAEHPLCQGKNLTHTMPVHNLIETFWDKVCGLHFTANLSKEEVHHQLRFNWLRVSDYYDLAMLYRAGMLEEALKHDHLLQYINLRKEVFYMHSKQAADTFKRGSLRLIPSEDVLSDIAKLYEKQVTFLHGDTLSFDDVIDDLRQLEPLLN